MAAVTRFGLEGYGVRRAGSFAGKTASTGADTNSGIQRLRSAAWTREHRQQQQWAEVARRRDAQYRAMLLAERRRAAREELQRAAEIEAAATLAEAPEVRTKAGVLAKTQAGEITALEAVTLIRRDVAAEMVRREELLRADLLRQAREDDDEAALIVIMLGS